MTRLALFIRVLFIPVLFIRHTSDGIYVPTDIDDPAALFTRHCSSRHCSSRHYSSDIFGSYLYFDRIISSITKSSQHPKLLQVKHATPTYANIRANCPGG